MDSLVEPAEARPQLTLGAIVVGQESAGVDRLRGIGAGPPFLVVLDDVSIWGADGLLPAALDLLGQAGIAVLMASARLAPSPDSLRWLNRATTWWISSLDAADVAPLRDQLQARGVTADVPLGALPPGVSILTTATTQGPVTATVYTGVDRRRTARAKGAQTRSDRSVAVAMASPPG